MLTLLPPMVTPADVIFLKIALKIRPIAYYRPGVGRPARALRTLRATFGYDLPLWDWWQSCW